jgi:hypothetical protein
MTRLASVELHQHAAAIGQVVDAGEQVTGLGDAADLSDGTSQCGWMIAALEHPHYLRGGNRPEVQRPGNAQEVFPVVADQVQVEPMARDGIQRAIVSGRIDPPKSSCSHVGQARAKAIPQQRKQPEDDVAVGCLVGHDLRWVEARILL